MYMNDEKTRVDHAPCVLGMACPLRDGGCTYYDRVKQAHASRLVVTNYAYWMTANKYKGRGEAIGNFDLIVCDEAHDTPDIVSSFLSIRLNREKGYVASVIPDGDLRGMTIADWKLWAKQVMPEVTAEMEHVRRQGAGVYSASAGRKYARMVSLKTDLETIIRDVDKDWVIATSASEVVLSPVWPAPYVERGLFMGTPNVILTSATVNMKTVDMLGVDRGNILMLEFPHSFPIENRRLIHVPTIRLNYKCTDAQLKVWVARIDQIIGQRLDRKGVVHTVSYKRRDMVLSNSKYERMMITHRRMNTESQVKKFKSSAPPSVLVSPSMATGWDFPYSEAEYQIIGKVAYPDSRDKIVEARQRVDKEYTSYIAMQQLVQACGRGVRAADDRCESFIIDDNITWFIQKYKKFAPRWFWDSYFNARTIPRPPPALTNATNMKKGE
jgi:Rad3-related DNA helicase